MQWCRCTLFSVLFESGSSVLCPFASYTFPSSGSTRVLTLVPNPQDAWGEPQFKAELKALQTLKKSLPRVEKAAALFINQVLDSGIECYSNSSDRKDLGR